MTTPVAPNAIGMYDVRFELGLGGQLDMNDGRVRTLGQAGGSGTQITMDQLRNKANYTAMSGSAWGDEYDYYYYGSIGTQYTQNLYSNLSLSGGTAPYTYLWAFESNPGGFTMVNETTSQCCVRHVVSKYGYTGECYVRVTITDSTGRQIVFSGVFFRIDVADQPM